MLNKVDVIERSRIMFEIIYGLSSESLKYDMCEMSYEEALIVYNSIRRLYELGTGESACV